MSYDTFLRPKPAPYIPYLAADGNFAEEDITRNETTERGRRWIFSRVNFLQEMMKFLPPSAVAEIAGETLPANAAPSELSGVHGRPTFPEGMESADFWGAQTISKEYFTPGLEFDPGSSDFQHFDFIGREPRAGEERTSSDYDSILYTDGNSGDINAAIDAFEFYDMTYVYKRKGAGNDDDKEMKFVLDYSRLFDSKKALAGSQNYYQFAADNFQRGGSSPGQDQGIAQILDMIESRRRIAYAMTDLFGSHRPYADTINGIDFTAYGSLDEKSDADKIAKTSQWLDPVSADWRGKESGQYNLFLLTPYFELWNYAGQWMNEISSGQNWRSDGSSPFTTQQWKSYQDWMKGIFANWSNADIYGGDFAGFKSTLAGYAAGSPTASQVTNLFSSFKILPVYVERELAKMNAGEESASAAVANIKAFFDNFGDIGSYKQYVLDILKAELFGNTTDQKGQKGVYYPQAGALGSISMYALSSEGFNGVDRGSDKEGYWKNNCEGWDGAKGTWTEKVNGRANKDELKGTIRDLFTGLESNDVTSKDLELDLWVNGRSKGKVKLYEYSWGFYTYNNLLRKSGVYMDYAISTMQSNRQNRLFHDRREDGWKQEKEIAQLREIDEKIGDNRAEAVKMRRKADEMRALQRKAQEMKSAPAAAKTKK